MGNHSREGYGLETHITHVINLPLASILNVASYPCYAFRITEVQYINLVGL